MDLIKLYDMQRKLMERIDYKGKDRFDKTILALLVEVGECANEWRGFKYWSQRQNPTEPHTEIKWVDSKPYRFTKNPLLEEYVDGLHFVLQLGIELKFEHIKPFCLLETDTLKIFTNIYTYIADLSMHGEECCYESVISEYLSLGLSLGFTDDEIFNAYMEKNEVNHTRQQEGY